MVELEGDSNISSGTTFVSNQEERYNVVRTGFWWRVKIGNGEQTVGKYFTKTGAMRLAAMLTRAYNDGLYAASLFADI